jgi:outer membrane beta-barrel protein
MTILRTTLILLVTGFGTAAWATDDPDYDGVAQEDDSSEDDDLGDILGGPTEEGEGSSEDETRDFTTGNTGDTVGDRQEDVILIEGDDGKARLIKTIQRKKFFKKGRWEASPHVAFVANDPFLNRYIVGSGINYNLTEIFAVELNLNFSPDLGDADWKPITTQLIDENHVSPDISKLTYFGSATFMFSPIYGKVAVVGRKIINFDIFAAFGMGMTQTSESLEALDAGLDNERAVLTQHQVHPTTNFGGGARIIFGENLALRLDGRSMVYIETVNATQLEMKNNFLIQGAVSVFFPRIK